MQLIRLLSYYVHSYTVSRRGRALHRYSKANAGVRFRASIARARITLKYTNKEKEDLYGHSCIEPEEDPGRAITRRKKQVKRAKSHFSSYMIYVLIVLDGWLHSRDGVVRVVVFKNETERKTERKRKIYKKREKECVRTRQIYIEK